MMDGSQKIQDVLLQASQAARVPLAITGFVRLQVRSPTLEFESESLPVCDMAVMQLLQCNPGRACLKGC